MTNKTIIFICIFFIGCGSSKNNGEEINSGTISLIEGQRIELKEEFDKEESRHYADKIRAILLRDKGKTFLEVEECLFPAPIAEEDIKTYEKIYKADGVYGLLHGHFH